MIRLSEEIVLKGSTYLDSYYRFSSWYFSVNFLDSSAYFCFCSGVSCFHSVPICLAFSITDPFKEGLLSFANRTNDTGGLLGFTGTRNLFLTMIQFRAACETPKTILWSNWLIMI